MKVFQINSVCGVGSTGRIAVDLKHYLEQQGHECRIAYGRGFYNESGCVCFSSKKEFLLHTALSRVTDRQGFYSKKATKRLIRQIKTFSPDVIHLHNVHGYYLNLPLLFGFLAEYNRPVVWTLHDCWVFTGHCAHFDFIGCDKWLTGCNHCPQKAEYPASLLFDQSAKNYLQKKQLFTALNKVHFVTPSLWLANLARRSFLKDKDIRTIHNGVDLNIFHPTTGNFVAQNKLEGKKIVLGVTNIWNDRKGLSDFIKLSTLLPENYQIVLVGLTEEQQKNLPKNILGITRTENAQKLAEIYSAAYVFVNPTYEDNYPTTNLEALSCHTPVITYRTGGSPESVTENSGFVVEKGDINGLIDAINRIDTLTEFSTVETNLENVYKEYLKLYEEVK